MIIRIVKMTFQTERVNDFLALFELVKIGIRSFEGCQQLELWHDKKDERIFFTYSIWNSQDDLDQYRFSELFKNTWATAQKSFAEKPEVHSIERLVTI
jgi:(4S)-4-hydroxy-5-phosphonooxypentane-2,3-dione isomerase